jgi:hypothetical protein
MSKGYEVWCERVVSRGKVHTSVVYYAPTWEEANRAARNHESWYDDVNRCWVVGPRKTGKADGEEES